MKFRKLIAYFTTLTLLFSLVSIPSYVNAEDNGDPDLICEEDFDYENGSLQGKNGGYGWGDKVWNVQNGHLVGYLVDNSTPISYPGLKSSKSYGTGGYAYCSAGRVFNLNDPKLSGFVSDNYIQTPGKTIWCSALLQAKSSAQSIAALSSSSFVPYDKGTIHFGHTSRSDKYFSINPEKIEEEDFEGNCISDKLIDSRAHLYVLKVEFISATSTKVSCYIDPDLAKEPSTPDMQITTKNQKLFFNSFHVNPGNSEDNGIYDAFRLGKTFESVTPITEAKLPVTKVKLVPANNDLDSLKGAKIVGSNQNATNGFEDIATIPEDITESPVIIEIPENTKIYRFVKLYGNAGTSGKLAEIEFYSYNRKLEGEPFATVANEGSATEYAFDGDVNTFFEGAQEDDQYIGLDLGGEIAAAKPTVDVQPGNYDDDIEIMLDTTTEGADIYYTIDGTTPTKENGILFTEAVKLTKGQGVILKAVAFIDGLQESEMFAGGYGIGVPAPIASGLRSYHLGNSLTDTTEGMFTKVTKSANYAHDYMRWSIPGASNQFLYSVKDDGNGFGVPWYNTTTERFATEAYAPIDVMVIQPFNNGDNANIGTGCAKEFYNKAREANPGIRFMIYSSWGSLPLEPNDTDFDHWYNEYTTWNEKIADDMNALYNDDPIIDVAPNALALKNLQQKVEAGEVPGVTNFTEFAAACQKDAGGGHVDTLHLSSNGAYLVNLVTFITMYKIKPHGLVTYKPDGMTEAQAEALQDIAWDTCVNYSYANVSMDSQPVVPTQQPTTQGPSDDPSNTPNPTEPPVETIAPVYEFSFNDGTDGFGGTEHVKDQGDKANGCIVANNGVMAWLNANKLEDNTEYEFSCSYKSMSEASFGAVSVILKYEGDADNSSAELTFAGDSLDGWKRVSTRFTTKKIVMLDAFNYIGFMCWANGPAYVDDIKIRKVLPGEDPTEGPTEGPTEDPTGEPTVGPTDGTVTPTDGTTIAPTDGTTVAPTDEPSDKPDTTKVTKPGKVKKLVVKNIKKKAMKVSFKKVSKAKGYKVYYSLNAKFKKSKTKTKTITKTSVKISKLKKGKKYYVKVKAYKTSKGKKIYGAYSAVKRVKIKK